MTGTGVEQSGRERCSNSAPALTKTIGEYRMADSPSKTCFVCKQSLPRAAFHKASNRPDGLYPYCRACDSQKRAAEKAADPEKAARNAKKKRAYDAIYTAKNVEKIRARSLAAYHENAEHKKAQIRKWQIANPEIVRAYKATSKAARRCVEKAGITGRELLAWKRETPKVCYWCSAKCAKHHHVDHYTPLSRGGKHEAANLVISCPTCNLRKHAKDPLDFAREVGRLL